jgi:hypothetical protein
MDYKNGKIYKIESHAGDKVYVGSTTKKYLSQRMDKHRRDYKGWKAEKGHFISSFILFDEYTLENCNIVLLENFECTSKDELRAREGHYIRTLDCVNKNIPGRTMKEYVEDNRDKVNAICRKSREKHKEKRNEEHRIYRENNKEKIMEHNKQPYECECGSHFQFYNKARHAKTEKHVKYLETI